MSATRQIEHGSRIYPANFRPHIFRSRTSDPSMKILIVSPNFPPLNSIAALRPYSWAKYWRVLGHDITVLTTTKPLSDRNLNYDLSRFDLIEIDIPGYNHLRRLDNTPNEHLPSESTTKYAVARRILDVLNEVRRSRGIFLGARMPDHHDLWVWPALRWARKKHWDLVVSSHGPYAAHLVALHLKKQGHAGKWIADFRDLWTQSHLFPGVFPFSVLERRIEKSIAFHADALTTVSKPLAKVLESTHGKVATVIENGIDLDDYQSLPVAPVFPRDGFFRIVYTGTVYPGKRDPGPLFEAIKSLREEGLQEVERVRLVFAGRNLGPIINLASSLGIADLVDHAGFVSREVALVMQRDANALLFLEFEAPGVDGILTGKIFEYLASQAPIIGVGVSPSSATGVLVEQAGAGQMLGNDVDRIKRYLIRLLRAEMPMERVPAFVRERYDRKILAERMLKLVS